MISNEVTIDLGRRGKGTINVLCVAKVLGADPTVAASNLSMGFNWAEFDPGADEWDALRYGLMAGQCKAPGPLCRDALLRMLAAAEAQGVMPSRVYIFDPRDGTYHDGKRVSSWVCAERAGLFTPSGVLNYLNDCNPQMHARLQAYCVRADSDATLAESPETSPAAQQPEPLVFASDDDLFTLTIA